MRRHTYIQNKTRTKQKGGNDNKQYCHGNSMFILPYFDKDTNCHEIVLPKNK